MDLASRALRVAGNDAEVLGNVARVFGYFSEDLAAAISLIDRVTMRRRRRGCSRRADRDIYSIIP